MKKNNLIIISFLLLIFISACSGYKPIFSSTNFNFIISDYEIMGDKVLGNQIYLKLRNISSTNKTDDIQNFKIFINASKEKKSTVKDSAGKILEYKIILSTKVFIKDYFTNEKILSEKFIDKFELKERKTIIRLYPGWIIGNDDIFLTPPSKFFYEKIYKKN